MAMIATSVAANPFKIQTEYLIAGQSNFIFYCRSDPRASICVQTEYSLQLGAASGPMVTGKGVERLVFILYPADSSCQSCPARRRCEHNEDSKHPSLHGRAARVPRGERGQHTLGNIVVLTSSRSGAHILHTCSYNLRILAPFASSKSFVREQIVPAASQVSATTLSFGLMPGAMAIL